jgi:CMP-N,N'-diacetyllegionaminic acid synthase
MPNSVLFLVCARNGSKGIRNKNLIPLGGKPLIHHTLDFLNECTFKSHLVLSTDGDPIALSCRKKVDWVIDRPAELATDEAGRYPVLIQALVSAEAHFGIQYDYVFDFLGTAPFRRMIDLEACYKLVQEPLVSNVITAVPSHRNPYFNMVECSANGAPQVVKNTSTFLRRQDAPATYDMNGSIYAWKRNHLMQTPALFGEQTRLHIMPAETGIDIDTEFDLKLANFMIDQMHAFEPEKS